MYAIPGAFRIPVVQDHSKLEYIACKDFLNNKCTHGDDCKYAHVVNASTLPKGALYQCLTRCGDFYNGNCARGEACKYAHIINAKQLEERHKRTTVAGATSIHSGTSVSRSRYCQDFRKGKCNRGAACKYSHAEELCRDFNRGECRFTAEQCRYVHKLYSEVDTTTDRDTSSKRSSSSYSESTTTTTTTSPSNNATSVTPQKEETTTNSFDDY